MYRSSGSAKGSGRFCSSTVPPFPKTVRRWFAWSTGRDRAVLGEEVLQVVAGELVELPVREVEREPGEHLLTGKDRVLGVVVERQLVEVAAGDLPDRGETIGFVFHGGLAQLSGCGEDHFRRQGRGRFPPPNPLCRCVTALP